MNKKFQFLLLRNLDFLLTDSLLCTKTFFKIFFAFHENFLKFGFPRFTYHNDDIGFDWFGCMLMYIIIAICGTGSVVNFNNFIQENFDNSKVKGNSFSFELKKLRVIEV